MWGIISIFKNMLSELMLPEITVVSIRLVISTVLFGIYMLIKNPKLFKIRIGDLWCFFGTGVLSLFLFSWCYFTAMSETSVGVAVTLLYTSPVFVTVMSVIFFKEKITKNKILSLILAVFGCIMVTELFGSNLEKLNIPGIISGLLSGFCYALYSIFGKFAIKRGCGSYTITFYTFLFAAVASLPFADFSQVAPVLSNGNFRLGSLGISVICCVLPYLFYTKGLEHTPSSKAAVLAVVEPVIGTLVGVCVFAESMSVYKFIGIVCVLLCTVILSKGE